MEAKEWLIVQGQQRLLIAAGCFLWWGSSKSPGAALSRSSCARSWRGREARELSRDVNGVCKEADRAGSSLAELALAKEEIQAMFRHNRGNSRIMQDPHDGFRTSCCGEGVQVCVSNAFAWERP